jgi:hypothetical protein
LEIEAAIVKDISTGRVDIYGAQTVDGALGTWAIYLGEYFEERDMLIDELCKALRSAFRASPILMNVRSAY